MADEVGVHHVVDAGDGEAECHGHAEGEERLEDGGVFEQVDVLRVFACAVGTVRAVSCGGCGVVGRVVFSLVGRHRFLGLRGVRCAVNDAVRDVVRAKKRASVLYRLHVVVGLEV